MSGDIVRDIFAIFICLLGLVAIGGLLFFVYVFVKWLIRLVFFKSHYLPVRSAPGKVVDMEFTPKRTYWNGKAQVTHPEKNQVSISSEVFEDTIDCDTLYQRVRIDDDIVIVFQPLFKEPRFWSGELEKDGIRLIRIDCPKDQSVTFHDEKPVDSQLIYKMKRLLGEES